MPVKSASGKNQLNISKSNACSRNCCVNQYFAPLFFVVFVLMAQFVLVNVVVAVLMKHLEESHKQVGQMAGAEVQQVLLYCVWRK